jgi:hypothetical protein
VIARRIGLRAKFSYDFAIDCDQSRRN